MTNKLTCKTGIPTADFALNIVRGCSNFDCPLHPQNKGECWAAKLCNRFAEPWSQYEQMYIGKLTNHYAKLKNFEPCWFQSQFKKVLPKKKPLFPYNQEKQWETCRIAVGWMSDFSCWPKEWVQKVIDKCAAHPDIIFQFLTKLPRRYGDFNWPSNCWLGATAMTKNQVSWAIEDFLEGLSKRDNSHCLFYLYLEPLLEDIEPDAHGIESVIEWIVVGGHNSGPPMDPDWVRKIRDWCIENGVPFFFKQHGAWIEHSQLSDLQWATKGKLLIQNGKAYYCFGKKSGHVLDGVEWREFPKVGK